LTEAPEYMKISPLRDLLQAKEALRAASRERT
jgi:hypothetical protein